MRFQLCDGLLFCINKISYGKQIKLTNEITGDFICWGRRVVRRCFEKVLRTGERRWFIKKSGMQGKFILSGR